MSEQYMDDGTYSSLGDAGLQGIEGFPYDTFASQKIYYEEQERWFYGLALDEKITGGSKSEEVDLYPLKINPLPSTVQKHVAVLFGEPQEDGRTPVYTKFVTDDDPDRKKLADDAEDFLNHLWWENNGREAMTVNGFNSHIYGGCVFKASFVPWDKSRIFPFRIDTVSPKNFVGFPDGGDRFRLRETWYAKEMLASEAEEYGYDGNDDVVWYVEHWLKDSYEILIDGKPASVSIAGISERFPLGGKNPFGFVPFIYIPHIRFTEFYGVPISANLKGMIKELNLRYGDYGDAVNEDSHTTTAMANTNNPKATRIGDISVFDLGSKTGLTTGEGEPKMWEVNTTKASSAMKDLLNLIWNQYRRDSFVPAVADGEDEGSQRSGLTLAIRFWPLTSHVNLERSFWSTGLDVFQHYLLKMAMIKRPKETKITKEHLLLRMKHKWASMLPRDREIEVAEWVNRASNDIASIETLLEASGDVEDIPEERQRILDWIKDKTEIEAEMAAKYPPPNQFGNPQGNPQGNKPKPSAPKKTSGG